MRIPQYTYNYKPAIYKYIQDSNILDKNKKENEILGMLVDGRTCSEIGNKIGYSERTVQRRRKEIYNKTKDLMF